MAPLTVHELVIQWGGSIIMAVAIVASMRAQIGALKDDMNDMRSRFQHWEDRMWQQKFKRNILEDE